MKRLRMNDMDFWEIENELIDSGYCYVCGVDEAGRGPLAGPVCAAAVILPRGIEIPGLNDSKKLSEKQRDKIYNIIISESISYGIAFGSVEEIEQHNILEATFIAMNRAIELLKPMPDFAIIDGNRSKGITVPAKAVVKGDSRCASIAAASILAKVTRDRYMYEAAVKYPEYHFEKHKGYGTKLHYEALREYGPCEIHRPSFLKKMH